MSKEDELLREIDRLQKEIRRVTFEDELTGLYNRNTYYERARRRLDKFPDNKYVIVCLDIEKFKFINDRFGFAEGDRLLSYIGGKVHERAERYNLVAGRLSADIFAFLDFEENVNTDTIGDEIQSWVSDYPLNTEIRIAVGVYRVEAIGLPVRLMCDRANLAVDTVKNNYIRNIAVYNKDVHDYMLAQNELLNDSDRAFAEREFKVYLQPKFDMRTNKIIGAESLVRWAHPKCGLVYPKDFIPLFEQNMLITKLDEYVWEETCRLLRRWIDNGYPVVPVSVNVSRIDIFELNVEDILLRLAEEYGLEKRLLEIEITESAFTNDENKMIDLVDSLRKNGFRVLMDDFGSGYSSLNMLKDINVDVLKIDTRFLEPGKDGNERGREILESVIRMAKWLGLETVAEGVETDVQRKFLLSHGCYFAQGFYFSRPVCEEEFEELIKKTGGVDTEAQIVDEEGNITIDELFHSDFMTDHLLNNILGGFALYAFDADNKIRLIKANDFYYDITKNYGVTHENILNTINVDDREAVIAAFHEARPAGIKGSTVQFRSIHNEKTHWITARLFYLADKKNYSLYYASISDSTEQMTLMNEFNLYRQCYKTALDMIEAVVVEYSFSDRSVEIKTTGDGYLLGYKINNVPKSLFDKDVIYERDIRTFKCFCSRVRRMRKPLTITLGLRRRGSMYKLCHITSQTVYDGEKPVKIIAVVTCNGEIVSGSE